MYKILNIICIILLCTLQSNAQNTSDTLSKNEERVVRLLGGFLKENLVKQLTETGANNGIKGILGKTFKTVTKRTIEKTGKNLLDNFNIGDGSNLLPNIFKSNKEDIIQQGKQSVVDNFQASLKNATADLLNNAVPIMVAKSLEFDVNDLIKFANSDSMKITDLFKNANKGALVKLVYPLAKASFKAKGGKKLLKQINKLNAQLTNGEKLDVSTILSENMVNQFFSEMKNQENLLKGNKLSLVTGLLDLLTE